MDACWVEVDLGKIRRNIEILKSRLSPGTKLLSVVKANGYGHGDAAVAKAAVSGGADWLGVARVDEGASLRAASIAKPILLLAEPPIGAVTRAVELGLTPTIYTLSMAEAFSSAGRHTGNGYVPVHVKIDTGMHRYGIHPADAASFLGSLREMSGIRVEGIWSHFAVAEDVLNPFTNRQADLFRQTIDELGEVAAGMMKHLSNSAAALTLPEAHLDMVRVGIATYGIHPSEDLRDRVSLEPALVFKSRVGLVKRIPKGDAISYGRRYTMTEEGNVATVPCGYADGLRRALSNNGEVLINGKRYPISGTITMDHFLVDVGDDEIGVGDEVVIIGKQGSEEITTSEIAKRLDTIPYEVVCGISSRVPRVYIES